MSLTTVSESNNDAGVFTFTASTAKHYDAPVSIQFRPRTFTQGGVTAAGPAHVEFDYAIVGMLDNEGFAESSFLTCMANMMLSDAGEEIAALVASGETFSVDIGREDQTVSGEGAYHRVKASTTRLSRRVAGGAYYQTFDDLRRLIDKLVSKADQQTRAIIGPETNHDFRVDMRAAILRLFMNADSKTAINYTHGLIMLVASSAITSASVDSEGKVNVVWNPDFLATLPDEAPEFEIRISLRLLYAWARQQGNEFTIETSGTRVQVEPTTGVLGVILAAESLNFNSPWDEVTASEDDLATVIRPSGVDYSPIPDYEIASATGRIVYVDPKQVLKPSDEFNGCARFEDNTNCLAVAMQLGAVSQSTADDVVENLGCVLWSSKDLKKKLNSERVTVALSNKALGDEAEAWVPKFDDKGYKKAVERRTENALIAMFGDTKQPTIPADVRLPVNESGVSVIIIHAVSADVAARAEEMLYALGEAEGLVHFTDTHGFSTQIAGPAYHLPIIIQGDDCSLSTFEARGERYSLAAIADLYNLEREHCIKRYKEMVQNGTGDPLSGGEEPTSYGWLALLVIPILGIILAAVISHGSRGKTRRNVGNQTIASNDSEPQDIAL